MDPFIEAEEATWRDAGLEAARDERSANAPPAIGFEGFIVPGSDR